MVLGYLFNLPNLLFLSLVKYEKHHEIHLFNKYLLSICAMKGFVAYANNSQKKSKTPHLLELVVLGIVGRINEIINILIQSFSHSKH